MDANSNVLIDLQYFGDINYYKSLIICTDVYFITSESYRKSDFSNRCRIAGANGPITLSVPLEKGRDQRTMFKEVRICNEEKWQLRHWKSIRSSYNGSPWFNHYADDMSALFSRRFDLLVEWNFECFQWVVKMFKLDISFSAYNDSNQLLSEMEITDLRKRTRASADQVENHLHYPQVFQDKFGFIPNLAIIDLLFCLGPKSGLELLR